MPSSTAPSSARHCCSGARSSTAARAARAGPALGASFATLMHGGLLGALITLAPYPLYAWYHGRTELWGLSALEDQQLAGLLMWVPMGIVYLAHAWCWPAGLSQPRRGGSARLLPSMLSQWKNCGYELFLWRRLQPSRDLLRSRESE